MTILVTRAEYDTLISLFPAYMVGDWLEMPKSWSLAGVTVTTQRQEMKLGLESRLQIVRKTLEDVSSRQAG